MQNRILFIDMLKGFTILCVIIGHLGVWHTSWFVYSFHMPLFFILSGFFFNPYKPIFERLRHLIIPYLLTALILTLVTCIHILHLWITDSLTDFAAICNIFKSIIYGSSMPHNFLGVRLEPIGAVWFLLGLCWASFIVRMMTKAKLSVCQSLIISFGLLIIGWQSAKIIFLPLSLQAGMIASFFVYIGGIIYKTQIWKSNKVVALSFGFWLLSLLLSYRILKHLGIGSCIFPYFPFDVIGSVAATIVLLALFQWAENQKFFPSRLFLFFGQATLVVLCFHCFELNKIDWRIRNICDHYELSRITTLFVLVVFKLLWVTMAIYLCRYISAYRKLRTNHTIPQY